jgi:hypothetical protein
MRRYLTERRDAAPFLAGLSDPAVRRAIEEVHADAARPWTVEGMARVAGG